MAGGTLHFERSLRVQEALAPGLKLVLVLDGDLRYSAAGESAATDISGPSLHLSLCRDASHLDHEFGARRPLRFVSLRIGLTELREAFDLDPDRLAGGLRAPCGLQAYADGNWRAGRAMQALGQQILACPVRGPLRQMYLCAKALELTALSLGVLEPAAGADAAGMSRQDIARLHHARDILLARLQDPPGLPELARQAGVNVNKLTTGFRRLFGASVYAFVRERRMERAHAMLASGDITVSEAAYACGYTDSHFTKAFRRQYGVLPSSLARCR